MATLLEYFDTEFKVGSIDSDWAMTRPSGERLPSVRLKLIQDFDANAKYWAFFIRAGCNVFGYAEAIFSMSETAVCMLSTNGDPIESWSSYAGEWGYTQSTELVFTKRVFLYIEENLTSTDRQAITDMGAGFGLKVIVYDNEYAKTRSKMEKPLAFISHDSRDKDALVRDLAMQMSALMCPVWYDEFSLQVGDSLRENIERGLRETRKCVVVLSPNFLSNTGWGKAEFNSVFTREIIEKNNVILPVWHNVTTEEVYQYSPSLADKLGLSSALGAKELARRLVHAINKGSE